MMARGASIGLIIIFILLAAQLAVLPACAGEYVVPPAPAYFVTDKYDHFYFMHDPGDDYTLTDMYMQSYDAYRIMQAFYTEFDFNVTVEIAKNHTQYETLIGQSGLSEATLGSGWGYGFLGKVIIKAPEINPRYKSVMAHELTHIATRTYVGNHRGDMPQWFEEGISVYVSGGLTPDMRTFIEYRCRDEVLMTVDEMEVTHRSSTGSFSNPDMVGAAYAQSGMVIEHIIGNYGGNQTIRTLLTDFSNTGDLNQSFMNILGKSPEDINREWRLMLKRELGVRDGNICLQKVYGTVYDQLSNPVPNITVTFTCMREDEFAKGRMYNATSDENGTYTVWVTYGPVKVSVLEDGYNYTAYNINVVDELNMLFNVRMAGTGKASAPSIVVINGENSGGFGFLPALIGFVLADLVAIGIITIVLKKKKN